MPEAVPWRDPRWGGPVDPPGQPAHDGPTCVADSGPIARRQAPTVGRTRAGSHDADRETFKPWATLEEKRRRVGMSCEVRGETWPAIQEEFDLHSTELISPLFGTDPSSGPRPFGNL